MSEGASLAFHAASPEADQALVVLLERRPDGLLRVTRWQAGAYHLPGEAGTTTAREMAEQVVAWHRQGWRLSESVARITAWLE